MATLLSIVTDALKDVGQQAIPEVVAGSSDATAELCLSLVNRLGRHLALAHDFQDLLAEHTFATSAGTSGYVLPADYRKFARLTHWDRGQGERVLGPVGPARWQGFQSAAVAAPVHSYFRIQGGTFNLYPTPAASGTTIAYEYYSKNWCRSSGGAGQDAFAADDDVALLDEELLILGLKYRFLRSRGEPYDDAQLDYQGYRDTLMANDNGPGVIRFGARRAVLGANIPETGVGG